MATGFTFDLEKCTECKRCMSACSIAKTGKVQLLESRIFVNRRWPELPQLQVCRFDDCDGHPCISACPVEAISSREGLILIDAETCTGCQACVSECPYNAIAMVRDIAVKCDFCGGDPECVKACVTAAIGRKGA